MKTNLITKSEYARRRGVALSAVTRAIAEGRITPVLVDGQEMIDPVAADAQWAANSRRRMGGSAAVPAQGGGHEPMELYVLPLASHDAEIVGLQAVPGRLPEIRRLPGEPLRAMLRRALREATPGPSFWCSPIIRKPHHE